MIGRMRQLDHRLPQVAVPMATAASSLLSKPCYDYMMRNTVRFLREFVCHPKRTGAVISSSKILAKAMVQALGQPAPGSVIVELGPGTGPFTRALHRQLPDQRHIAIEHNGRFAELLRQRMPNTSVIEGCASQLPKILDAAGVASKEVAGIISGLPLISFPPTLRTDIFTALAQVLGHGQPMVQFTYSLRCFRRLCPPAFTLEPHRRILLNCPPAQVVILRLAEACQPACV